MKSGEVIPHTNTSGSCSVASYLRNIVLGRPFKSSRITCLGFACSAVHCRPVRVCSMLHKAVDALTLQHQVDTKMKPIVIFPLSPFEYMRKRMTP